MTEFKLRIDLRDYRIDEMDAAVAAAGPHAGFLLTAWQWAAWNRDKHASHLAKRMIIVVPDFLYYARLGSTGQAKRIIQLPESKLRVLQSAFASTGTGIRNLRGLASGDFWAAAEALMAFDMGLLESGFDGEVVLQYNLADFCWPFERRTFVERYSRLAGKARVWGLSTQQIGTALSACARWNLKPGRIMFTSGYKRPETDVVSIATRDYYGDTRLTLDLTQWPAEMICGDNAGDLRRAFDDEWLVTPEAGMKLLAASSMLTQ